MKIYYLTAFYLYLYKFPDKKLLKNNKKLSKKEFKQDFVKFSVILE